MTPPRLKTRQGQRQLLYHCPTCNRRFKNQLQRERHLLVHGPQRPFGCLLCDYAATKMSALSAHVRKHLFLYVCGRCGVTCMSSQRLKAHLKERHPDAEPEQAFVDCINGSYCLIQQGDDAWREGPEEQARGARGGEEEGTAAGEEEGGGRPEPAAEDGGAPARTDEAELRAERTEAEDVAGEGGDDPQSGETEAGGGGGREQGEVEGRGENGGVAISEVKSLEAASSQKVSAEDTAVEDTATEDTAAQDIAVEDTAAQDITVEDTATEDTAVEDITVGDTAAEDVYAKLPGGSAQKDGVDEVSLLPDAEETPAHVSDSGAAPEDPKTVQDGAEDNPTSAFVKTDGGTAVESSDHPHPPSAQPAQTPASTGTPDVESSHRDLPPEESPNTGVKDGSESRSETVSKSMPFVIIVVVAEISI